MHADDALGMPGRLRDRRDGERGGIRREHGVRTRDAVELGEQLPLRLELLDDRLDHEIAVREVGEVRREREPRKCRVALVGPHPSLLDASAQVALDRRAPPFGELQRDLPADGVVPCRDGDLRDPRPHRPEPHDADLHGRDPRTHMKRTRP